DQFDILVIYERMERAHRVASSPHRSNDGDREGPFMRNDLLLYLSPYDALKVPHHHRIRMRSHDRTDQVVGVVEIRDPVSKCLIYRVFECLRSALYGVDSRPEKFHAEDV